MHGTCAFLVALVVAPAVTTFESPAAKTVTEVRLIDRRDE